MKVSDVMSTTLDYVNKDTKVKEICRIIFGRGINGVPVCKGKKVIGFISERDILAKFFPTQAEFAESPFKEGNFEEMEEKADYIFSLTAEKIMSKNISTITADTPLMRAQSTMLVKKVGRLPVVDSKGNLVGMISKGDIFRAAVGDKLPFTAEEEYHDWQAKHYDIITDWSQRLSNEIPDLVALFKKHNVKNVLDIGYGTGEHDIALAREGFDVLGVESSRFMYNTAEKKRQDLPKNIADRLTFTTGSYVKTLSSSGQELKAAIFMGNAFPHLVPHYNQVFSSVAKLLPQKGALVVLQVTNFEKIFKVRNRIIDTTFGKSKKDFLAEHLFVRYYDPADKNGYLTLNTAIFDHDGKRWKFRTMNSTSIVNLNKAKIEAFLKKYGFKKISFYGGNYFGRLFKEPFKLLESDWLNVIAER